MRNNQRQFRLILQFDGKRCEWKRRMVRYNADRFIANIVRWKRKLLLHDVQTYETRIGTRRRERTRKSFLRHRSTGYRWNKNLDRMHALSFSLRTVDGRDSKCVSQCNSIILCDTHVFSFVRYNTTRTYVRTRQVPWLTTKDSRDLLQDYKKITVIICTQKKKPHSCARVRPRQFTKNE